MRVKNKPEKMMCLITSFVLLQNIQQQQEKKNKNRSFGGQSNISSIMEFLYVYRKRTDINTGRNIIYFAWIIRIIKSILYLLSCRRWWKRCPNQFHRSKPVSHRWGLGETCCLLSWAQTIIHWLMLLLCLRTWLRHHSSQPKFLSANFREIDYQGTYFP